MFPNQPFDNSQLFLIKPNTRQTRHQKIFLNIFQQKSQLLRKSDSLLVIHTRKLSHCQTTWLTFSKTYVFTKLLQLCPTLYDPMDCSRPGSSVQGFSRQEYWSGLLCSPAGDLPNPGTKPDSLTSIALAGRFFTMSGTQESQ